KLCRTRRQPGMIETRAPGKLYIAGEYAVVSPGQPAVLVAVDRCIAVRLTESEGAGRIHSSEYGQAPLVWRREQDGEAIILEHRPADYVLSAIAAVEELRAARGAAPRYFDLNISSELDDADGRKFGLGSSGAVTVATIAALNRFYSLGLTPTERFKLALLATIAISPNASGGDLAASTFGGWIRYSSPAPTAPPSRPAPLGRSPPRQHLRRVDPLLLPRPRRPARPPGRTRSRLGDDGPGLGRLLGQTADPSELAGPPRGMDGFTGLDRAPRRTRPHTEE